jgi:plasmid stabilization system protein ParE
MKKEVFWTKRADKSYGKLNNYIESEWGIDIANSFSKKMFNIIDLITIFPEMGIHEYNGIRSFPIAKKISIFYKTNSDYLITSKTPIIN